MKRVISILICLIIVLLGCLRFAARFDYCGVPLLYNQGIRPTYPLEWTDEYKKGGYLTFEDFQFFENRFGQVAVVRTERKTDTNNYHCERLGTYAPKIRTNLTMLRLFKGMTIPQIINAVGAPDAQEGSGISYLVFDTVDGYQYAISVHGSDDKDLYTHLVIHAPNGKEYSGEEAERFQWKLRFVYLGVAAILSGILVCLLVIPKRIDV